MPHKWFPYGEFDIKTILLCFHHAGSSASVFKNWVNGSGKISVVPVELPGKGSRINENFVFDMDRLVPMIVNAVSSAFMDRDIYIYGHSMGAAIAFAVASRLEKKLPLNFKELIVSGRQPPHYESVDLYHSSMGEEELIKELKRLNGTPEAVFENADILKFFLPIIRNDYILNESFQYKNEILGTAIKAYAGIKDTETKPDIMSHWSEVTNARFSLKEINGTHFFPFDENIEFYEELQRHIISENNYLSRVLK